jgi:Ca-activated chloride channel family protein
MQRTGILLASLGAAAILVPGLLSQNQSAQPEPPQAEAQAEAQQTQPFPLIPPPPPFSTLPSLPPPPPRKPRTVQFDSSGKLVRKDGVKARNRKDSKTAAPAAPGVEEFKISTDVELVLLDVSVKDSQGGFVSGLTKENFKITDNKIPQEITVFQAEDVPVTVGLVVDNSGSVRPKKPEIVTAALTLVKNSNPQDEVFVINFNDRVLKGLPEGVEFTDDHVALREALLLNPAKGRTSLYDGLEEALEHIEKGRLDKKTLVLVADGGDNMSETTREEIIRAVETSLATIYTIGIYNPDDKDKDPGFLKQLAEISGGEYYRPRNISHLVGVCEKIAHDIRNRYTIGYSPKNIHHDGKVRKLNVTASQPDAGRRLHVRTRTQYQTALLDEKAESERE